jgi:translation initiation factor IF-2
MIDDVKKAMAGLLSPDEKVVEIGAAEVRNVFRISKVGAIAGCYVIQGKIQRNAFGRLVRDQVVVFEGKLSSLKRFKDDAKEVAEGYECGIGLENFNDIKIGDVIEAYIIEKTAAVL